MIRKLRKAFPLKNKKKIQKKSQESYVIVDSMEKEKDTSDNSDDSDDFRCKEATRYAKLRQKKQIQLPDINLDEYVDVSS